MPRSPDRRHRAGDGQADPRPARRRLRAADAGQAGPGARAVPGHRHLPRRRRRGTAPAHLLGDANPVTGPVRHTSQADQEWADLASQLTPAASLARIDAVTARAGTPLTVTRLLLPRLVTPAA